MITFEIFQDRALQGGEMVLNGLIFGQFQLWESMVVIKGQLYKGYEGLKMTFQEFPVWEGMVVLKVLISTIFSLRGVVILKGLNLDTVHFWRISGGLDTSFG